MKGNTVPVVNYYYETYYIIVKVNPCIADNSNDTTYKDTKDASFILTFMKKN